MLSILEKVKHQVKPNKQMILTLKDMGFLVSQIHGGEGGSKKVKTPLRNIKMVPIYLPSFAILDLRRGCGKQWGQKSMKLELELLLEFYLLGQYFDYLTVQT